MELDINLGIILSEDIPHVSALSESLNISIWPLSDDGPSLPAAVARVLGEGPWMTRGELDVAINDTEVAASFAKHAAIEGLCVLRPSQLYQLKNFEADQSEIRVIIGDENFIINSIINYENETLQFVVPTDDNNTYIKDLSNSTIIFLKNKVSSTTRDIQSIYQLGNSILNIADMLNRYISEYCENDTVIYSDFPPFVKKQFKIPNKKSLQEILDIFLIEDNELSYYYDILMRTNDTENENGLLNIGNFNVITDVLTFNFNEDSSEEKAKYFAHAKCLQDHDPVQYCKTTADTCSNYFKGNHHQYHDYLYLYLRKDPWVPASLAVSGIGVFTTLAILLFVIIRLCKGDIMEGNPLATIILLLSLLPMFASIIPFSVTFEDHEQNQKLVITQSRYENFEHDFLQLNQNILCAWRVFVLSVSYCLLFSQLLSRAIMLCSVGSEGGFLSHVNGFLQITICFFMFLVQLSISSQLLVYHLKDTSDVNLCRNIFDSDYYLTAISYNVFLLISLLIITPFVYRSQRNYMEGMLMTVASYIIAIAWFVWILISVLFSSGSTCKEASVPLGLVSTAWIVLGGILVPRSYLIVRGIARSDLVQALPSLTSISFAPRSNHYISRQTIYDCVNPAMLQRSVFPASELPTLPMRPPRRMQHEMIEGHAPYDTPPRSPTLMNGRGLDDGEKAMSFEKKREIIEKYENGYDVRA
ncbi:protein bride of sevenless-like [Ctenocephalides felis]|uniref:protein bride of sevenless-like n=1 Tax=Ctenocephalides felis TaxID=7515 RepID=UPI000E6E26CA|nr:protein bride of sevenless-like [Ctenocephalides felis]